MTHLWMFRTLTVMMMAAAVWAMQTGNPGVVTFGICAVLCYLGVLAERFLGEETA